MFRLRNGSQQISYLSIGVEIRPAFRYRIATGRSIVSPLSGRCTSKSRTVARPRWIRGEKSCNAGSELVSVRACSVSGSCDLCTIRYFSSSSALRCLLSEHDRSHKDEGQKTSRHRQWPKGLRTLLREWRVFLSVSLAFTPLLHPHLTFHLATPCLHPSTYPTHSHKLQPKWVKEDLLAGFTLTMVAMPLNLAIALGSGVPAEVTFTQKREERGERRRGEGGEQSEMRTQFLAVRPGYWCPGRGDRIAFRRDSIGR